MLVTDHSLTIMYGEDHMSTRTAAIYCRISDDREGLSLGVARQEQDCRDVAHAEGYGSVVVFVDNDKGASSRSRAKVRPAYSAMLARARAGEFGAIIAYSNSRLTRRLMEFEDLIRLHEQTGVLIKTKVSGQDDLSTADGRMVARIKATVDAAEAERTGERVSRVHLANAMSGKPVGGYRPFGWLPDKRTLDPVEAELVRQAVKALLAGSSVRSVVRAWGQAGVLTTAGKEWTPATLRQYLKNPRLRGVRTYKGSVLVGEDGKPVRGLWEPLLGVDEHERVAAMFTKPDLRSRVPRKGARHYLLTGLLKCGNAGCQRSMYGNARGELHYYACHGANDGHTVSVSGTGADEWISRLIVERMTQEGSLDAPVQAWPGETRLAAIEAEIQELMDGLNKGVSGDLIWPRVARLDEERLGMQKDRAQWLVRTTTPGLAEVTPASFSEEEDMDIRRAIIEHYLDAVIVKPAVRRRNTLDLERLVPVWRPAPPALRVVPQ